MAWGECDAMYLSGVADRLGEVANVIERYDADLSQQCLARSELLRTEDTARRAEFESALQHLAEADKRHPRPNERERARAAIVTALRRHYVEQLRLAQTETVDSRERLRALKRTLSYADKWRLIEAASAPPTESLKALLPELTGKAADAQTREDEEVRIAALKAEAEAAQRQREAKARERQEREMSRPLLCCDGTNSPTCLCHGNHGGCCSHHHGVCGCGSID
jgi:hypothetical protein